MARCSAEIQIQAPGWLPPSGQDQLHKSRAVEPNLDQRAQNASSRSVSAERPEFTHAVLIGPLAAANRAAESDDRLVAEPPQATRPQHAKMARSLPISPCPLLHLSPICVGGLFSLPLLWRNLRGGAIHDGMGGARDSRRKRSEPECRGP